MARLASPATAGPETTVLSAARAAASRIAQSPRRAFVFIFLLAAVVRCALLFSPMIPAEYLQPNTNWEVPAVAASVAQTGRYADPYLVPTGATAHPLPLYTGLLAVVYRLFGLTVTAGYVTSVLAIASHSALYAMLPWVAARLGLGAPVGVLAGVAGAFLLRLGAAEVLGGLSEPYAAIALCLLLVATVQRWTGPASTVGHSLLLGLGWGIAFHVQPALLFVMLGLLAFELWWRKTRQTWYSIAVITAGVLLALLPWGIRNYAAFGEVVFIRSNVGLELRMGNHEGAAAAMDVMDVRQPGRHPRTHMAEAVLLQELGEMEYMRRAKREALDWIKANPAEFLALTASRVVHFWCGPLHRPGSAAVVTLLTLLALFGAWRILPTIAAPSRAALLIPLATFPLVYYVVAYMERYRAPIDWILLLLAAAGAWDMTRTWMRSEIVRNRGVS